MALHKRSHRETGWGADTGLPAASNLTLVVWRASEECMGYMSAHVLEAGEGADAGLPAPLPPGDAPVARFAAREGVAAPAHVRDDLILQAPQESSHGGMLAAAQLA